MSACTDSHSNSILESWATLSTFLIAMTSNWRYINSPSFTKSVSSNTGSHLSMQDHEIVNTMSEISWTDLGGNSRSSESIGGDDSLAVFFVVGWRVLAHLTVCFREEDGIEWVQALTDSVRGRFDLRCVDPGIIEGGFDGKLFLRKLVLWEPEIRGWCTKTFDPDCNMTLHTDWLVFMSASLSVLKLKIHIC